VRVATKVAVDRQASGTMQYGYHTYRKIYPALQQIFQ
jgi:hypothetical protein